MMDRLRCPVCGAGFGVAPVESSIVCRNGHKFAYLDGIPDLVHPRTLAPSDEEFRRKYDLGAESYDDGLSWMWDAFATDEDATREAMIDLLGLEPGSHVLETGCGTGQDSTRIRARLGPSGQLVAQDLSIGMLHVAKRRVTGMQPGVDLVLSNASRLPFADASFDASYHFGGINTFGQRRNAIAEMTRVVKPGGRVVFGDEGIAPWLRRRRIGRILVNANPLYAHRPPVDELPENALNVSLRWIIGNAFYVVAYTVGASAPVVELDLPIPGKGDTLRSRYDERPR